MKTIEKCLAAICRYIIYVTRGRKFTTVEASFKTAEKDLEHSVSPLKN